MKLEMKYTCPCCGYKTLEAQPPGNYDLCPVCFWEDDGVQFDDPDYEGGANEVSLRQAQQNFREFGACDPRASTSVRSPAEDELRDEAWRPL
jgi:hypothetical protein